jgi:hypothetical protein
MLHVYHVPGQHGTEYVSTSYEQTTVGPAMVAVGERIGTMTLVAKGHI